MKKKIIEILIRKKTRLRSVYCSVKKIKEVNIPTIICEVHLNSGVVLKAMFRLGTLCIKAVNQQGEILERITLQGHIHNEKNKFYLQMIENGNVKTEKTGVATYMIRQLLTVIDNYNGMVSVENQIKIIEGSIKPDLEKNLSDLKKFYIKKDGLTDIEKKLYIQIDVEKCEKENLLQYYIHPIK